MLFSSLTFLFGFLPLLFLLYFIIPSRKIKNIVLLLFSLIFYAWGEPKYIVLMLITTLVSYVLGLLIDHFKNRTKIKRSLLVISIILIIGNLIFFKYTNFIIKNINLFVSNEISFIEVILPIGISFYTFQILSYIFDLYMNKIKVQKSFISLALYVSLFPQLIAGPIVRYSTIENELQNRKETFSGVKSGIKRFVIGLSKKVLIANQMGVIADSIFGNLGAEIGTSITWLGILAYTLQIYFDFSGYSDMAIGLGKIFGFTFLENFNYPYISKSITEFWRRWHISLSSWFRDYVYIPLGGNRVEKWKWIRNILIVWILTGIWHGASWNFALWGLYFAIILLIEKIFLSKILEKAPKFVQWMYSIFLIMFGWIIFRCESLELLGTTLQQAFIYKKSDWITFINGNSDILFGALFIIPAIIFSFPILPKLKEKFKNSVILYCCYNVIIVILFIMSVTFLTSATYNPFIYFRF